jgi:hypothetical protein
MKVFDITGKLHVKDDLTHQELLEQLYIELKKLGIHFVGETKINKQ